MLRIRLQRLGKKKQPTYRFIVSEKTKDTQAGSLEILGHYNPILKEKIIDLKEDRIKHWLSMGAQPSETVQNILINAGIMTGKKGKSVAISNKRKGKLEAKRAEKEEKMKAAEEKKKAEAEAKKAAEAEAKAKAAEEAAAAKEAEAKAAAEAPAEEKPAEENPSADAEDKEDPSAEAQDAE